VIRLSLCLAGDEDVQKTTVSASDPGQQSAVPHYDVTLDGLQLALMDRHNFSGANSSKAILIIIKFLYLIWSLPRYSESL